MKRKYFSLIGPSLKILMLTMAFLVVGNFSYGQSTVVTVPPINGTTTWGGITFNLASSASIIIDTIYVNTSGTGTVDLEVWYNPSPINGQPAAFSGAPWVNVVVSQTLPAGTDLAAIPIPGGLTVPAASNWGFYIGNPSFANDGLRYGSSGSVTTVTDGTVSIEIGPNVGYGWLRNTASTTNHPRYFAGGVHYNFAAACSGQPAAGTTTGPASSVCANENFILSLSGNTSASDLSYQWMSAPTASGPWTYLPGATSVSLDTFQLTDTYYACEVTCDNSLLSDTSIALLVTTNPNLAAGTYTIGATGDYANFAAAIAAMSCGIAGPVVFEVQAGVYPESVQLTEILNASATNTVTFDGIDSTLVTLEFDGTAGTSGSDYAVVYLNGADYITFKNMTVRHTGTGTDEWGFLLSNEANYNTVEACKIEVNPSGTSDVAGVVFSSSETTDAGEENNANYNTFIGNKISGGEINISIDGDFGAKNVGNKFINNYLFGADDYGIYSDEQDSLWIIGNTIRGLRTAAGADGIYLFDHDNFMIVGNDVIAPDWGIYVNDGNDAYTPVTPSVVANNMVISETDYAIYLNDVETTDFIHNNVQGNPGLGLNDVETGLRVVNNILTSWDGFAVDYADVNPLDSVDYNIYFTPPSNPNFVEIGTTSFVDLVDFQTNVPGYNLNSLEGDPVFVSPTSDLHVLGALADSAATSSDLLVDIDGETRNPSFPDIGADEFELFNNDAGITNLPLTSICPGNSDISVTLFNYGGQDLNNVFIFWTVNGAFQSPFSFGGTLPPTQDSSFVIGSFNFSGGSQTYDIRVWTSMPNGGSDQNNLNDTLFISGVRTALSGNYTIDPSGTGDFLSFNDAANALSSYGVCGPVVITAVSGVYAESVQLTEIAGASDVNTVTFDGTDSLSVTLEYDGTAGSSASDYAVVYLNGTDYVTFKNMTVRHTGTGSDEWGFLLSNIANYNTIEACRIEVNPGGTSDVAGVVFSNSETDDNSEENNANYNTVIGNIISGGERNIVVEGDFGAMNVGNKFIRNKLLGADDYGIYSDEQDSLWIEGNYIRGLRTAAAADGIYLIDQNNYTIIGNDIIAPDYGIYVNDGNDAYTPAAPSLVANNMVISETDYAVYLNDIESTDFFHNTVMGDPGLQLNDAETAVRVVNNIMASMNDYAFDHLDSDPLDSMDYNIYYTPLSNPNFVQIGTVSFTDLADFQANYPSGFNTNSLEGDPIFLSATDLRVLGTLADSAATPIGITDDIDGNVRNADFPDIGAYEYDLLNRDVGVTNIPVASICPGTSDVIVEITNFGLNANSSAQIFWSVNGVLQSPFSFGGVLPSFGDTSLVIGSYTFGNFSQSYDIVAWTANPNGLTDQDISNDTTIVLNVRTGLDGTYIIDTSGAGDFLNFNDAANALVSYGVCGPVVFNAVPGVYLESVQLPQIVGASDINTITFDGADSTLVTLQFDGTSGASGSNYAVVYLNGADYVTFKNMTIKHTGTGSDEWGFLLSNEANYNTVEACKIEMNPAGTSDVAGVVFSSSETTDAGEENNANYNTFIGNKISGGEINVSIDGDFGAMNVGNKFIRNMLLGADDYGIYSDEQDSLWIEGNYIRGLRAAGADGIYLIDHNNYTIIGNDIIAPDYGIYVNDGNDGYTPAAPSLVANNMVISETDDAVYLNDIESTDFFHNTVMGDPGLQLNDAETAVRVVNNIMASMTDYAFDHLDSDPLDSMDYNIYYTPSTNSNFVQVGTVSFTDLADFQANYPSGFNTNSLEGNPFFVSATDLRVLGTLADSAATLSAITTDIDGNVRNANFPDIGAYEYDVKAVDAVMSEVLSQPLDDCDIIDNEIIVSIQSFGADTLSNVDVYYSVNGSAPVLGGSGVNDLNLGDSEIITLTGFDFTQDGVYNIEIFVSVANDEDLSNDTLTTIVENLAIPDLLVNSISAICDSGVATVEVSSTANFINWYLSADTSATLYASGDSVVSPFLTETDTLYAQLIDEQSGSVGPVDNSFGISGNVWNLTYGLYFDVFSTTRIISVDVYPTGSGDIEFIVEDNGGNTVASTIVPITGGSTTVPFTAVLNLTVPPGTDYLLRPGAASTTQVTRNSAGANYPYTLPGVVSITGNAFDGGPGPYYYYFYNWQVTVPGCNSDFIPVVVPVNSSPTVNLGADLEICPGQPETLDAGNAGASFAWSTGDTSQVISVSQSGDYSVTITDANSCSASDTASAIVLPGVSVDLGPDTVLCDTAWVIFDGGTGFDSYLWTLNGVVVGNTPMITVEDPGTYYLTATSADGCIAVDSANIAIESCIGIAGVFGDNTINVYPNPNSGQFNLSIEVKEPVKASFSVHDINGKVLYNEVLNLTVGKRTFNYDFDEFLSTGVYLIKFTSDEEHYVERIVVE